MGHGAGRQRPAAGVAIYVRASAAYQTDAAAAIIRRQVTTIRERMPAGRHAGTVYAGTGHTDEEAAAICDSAEIRPAGRITAMLAAARQEGHR